MIASTQFLLKAIGEALRNEVLPALDLASMPAGNLRGCLMLLAYLEDRVTREGPVLVANNRTLRALLRGLGARAALPFDADLRERIDTTLRQYPDRPDFVGIVDLSQENETYQQLLSEILQTTRDRRDAFDPDCYDSLRKQLHACLLLLDEREYAIVERAQAFTPI